MKKSIFYIYLPKLNVSLNLNIEKLNKRKITKTYINMLIIIMKTHNKIIKLVTKTIKNIFLQLNKH